MKIKSPASHSFRLMAFLLLVLAGWFPVMAQEAKEYPLGPIGGTYRVTAGSSMALVARLTAGEPGVTSGLQVNDAIYGAFGQVFTPTGSWHFGVTQELGIAVDRAESGDGVLPLMILRPGVGGMTVNVNLAATGAFGVAYPRNSTKFEAMYENAVAALHTRAMNSNGDMGYLTGWTGLALLSHPNWNSTTGDKPYRLSINKIRDLIITRLNASIYAPMEPILLPTGPGQANGGDNPNINYNDTGFSNWVLGPMVMFLAEYHAKTSDAAAATTLQRGAEMCANSIQWWKQPSQTGVGGYSPGYDQMAGMVGHNGVHGDYIHQGYPGINMSGVHIFNGMAFSRRAGMDMSVRPRDGHYFGYTLNQGDTIPAGVAGCLPSSITLPKYGADPVRGATITDPFWYDMSVHQKFVMQMDFLVRRSAYYASTPLTGDDGAVAYAPGAGGSAYDAGGRTPGALLGMFMYQQDVGGLDSADLARLESLKGFITRNYMQHQDAHAFSIGAQIFQAMCAPYLGDREQRFFMDNWRFFFALSRTSSNGTKYFPARTLIDSYLDWDHCALLNSALPYGIANGRFSLIPGYNTTRTLANFKSPVLKWPTLAARTATVNASTQEFQIDVCDGEGNVLAPAAYSAAWSFVSGPASATFSSNSTAATTVTFPSVSATPYRIRLTVTRAGFPTLTEDIDITRADPVAPVANAITTQPVAQATPPGGNASFTVAVSGTGPFLYQWRLNGVPYWGTTTTPTLQLTNVGTNSAGSYDCVISTPGTVLTTVAAPLTISATIVRKTGGLKREDWYGVGGGAVSDLTNNANYPLFPSATGMVSAAESGETSNINYGEKLSGWLTPPVSGPYKFHLASYEASQLWLSTDSLAANLVKIAEVGGNTGFRAYSSGGHSVQVNLVAGQKYYLEILHKKGGGNNGHVSVAWQFPGENVPADGSAPIDGVYLEYDQLQEKLTNHWKLDEASAATCIDSAGGVTATLYNGPVRINDGVMNGALAFNGVNQYAKAAVHVSANSYAASLWFRTSQADGGMFAVTGDNGDNDRNIYLVGGNIKARIWSEEIIASTGKAYGDGLWHHVVHTYGGATGGQKLYVDGELVASGGKSQSDLVWASSILIGDSTRGTTRYFNGSIDDVRLYYGALSAQDVTALYQGTIPPVTNTAPQITTNTLTVADNSVLATPIGTITATDANAGQTLTYSLVGGNVGNRFALDAASGLLTVNGALDFSGIPAYLLTVRVTDNGSPAMSTDAIVTVNLTNTNDPPVFLTNPMAMGGLKDVAFSGMLAATDPDAGDSLTYSKVSGPAWLTVAANGALGGIPSQSDVGANSFVVRVTDPGGLTDDAVLNIGVSENTIWTNPAGGSWLVTGNWLSGSIANGSNATANFNTLNPTADVTVTLDADRTIGNLIFGDTDTGSAAGWIVAGNKLTLASVTGTAPVVTVDALGSGKEATISSILMGTQGFVKAGAGILNLSTGNNDYAGITGGIVVNNGILKLSATNAIRGTLTINSGGEVRQNASWSLGTDFGQATSAYTNTININGGILNFAVLGGGMVANINMSGGEIKSAGSVDWYTVAAGGGRTLTTLASGSTALVSTNLNLRMGNNNGGTAIFDVADGGVFTGVDFKISGVISEQVGGSQNLLKTGAGTMELSAANNFAGITKVAAGVLKLTNNLALQNSALDTSGAGTVTMTGTTPRLGGLMGGKDLATVITSGYGSVTGITLNNYTGKTHSYSGIIANGAANMTLTKSGSGVQVLSGANTYSGITNVIAGSLIARSASALGTGNVSIAANTGFSYAAATDGQLALGGTLAITGGSSTVIGGSIGSTTTSAQINVAGAATISNAAHKVNVYGIVGVAPVAGTNTYTLIHGGAGSSLSPATAPTLGTVYNASNFTVGALSRTATDLLVDITSATALTTAYWKGTATAGITKVWAISNGSPDSNWTDTAGGSVQSLVPGFTTDVFISATSPTAAPTGTTLGANMSIKSLTIQDTANGLSVNADGYTLTVGTGGITMNAGVPNSTIAANVALGSDQIWTNDSVTSKTLTVGGAVSGGFSLTKAGGGLLALGGVNTYTGGTLINGGTLQASVAGALPDDGAVTLANTSGAVLNLNGFNQTISTLSGGGAAGGNIALGAATLSVNQADDSQFAGVISGSGGLLKTGAGSLALAGANSYSGTTMIGGGALLMNGINTGTGAFSVASSGTLGGSGRISGPVSNNGTLAPGGGAIGNLTVTNSLTLGADSAIAWQVADWTGIAGTGYDLLTVNSLSITATSTHPVVIRLSEQALLHFTEATSTFTLVESTGGITGFQPGKFVLDTTGLPGARYGWSIQQTGNRLELKYSYRLNTAPVFASNPILMSGTQGTAITGSITAIDPDPEEILIFSKTSGPAWLAIAANGDLSGTPLNEHAGLNVFAVQVMDSRGATATATLNFTIANLNDAPVFVVNPITGVNATEDSAYSGSLATAATDIDAGDTLVFSKVSGPAWLVIAPDGTLSGTPDNSDVGPNGFVVRITDAGGLFAESDLGIYVANTNDAPAFTTDPFTAAATEATAFNGAVTATDVDADDTLTYSKVSGPAWLFVASDGSLGGMPGNSDVGANAFVVRVTDADGLSDDAVLNISVSNNDSIWINAAGGSWLVPGNWLSGNIANGAGFTANFNTLNPTADVTVTLDADRTIGNLIFGDTDTSSAAGWIIGSGSKLTLASVTGSAPIVTVNTLGTGKEASINSLLMGSQGFIKEGAGTLTLTADNNGFNGITGGIMVNNGILKLSRSNSIRGTLTINSGGEVRQNASWSLGQDGGQAVSGYTNTININGGILNFAVLGGGMVANVNMTGGEIKSFNNGNVDWFAVSARGGLTLTTLASSSTALVSSGLYLRMGNNNGGTAIFDVADGDAAIDFKISGVISEQTAGTQNLLKKGAGTMELSAANSFAGSTKVAEGVLKLTNNLALQSSGLDTSGAGTVTVTGTTPRLGGLMGGTDLASVITSGYSAVTTLQLSPPSSKTLTYSGIIANGAANMNLSLMNSGTQILSGANTYSGTTSITAGTLIARSASALGTGNVTVGTNTRLLYEAAADAQLALGGTLAVTGGSSTTIGGSIGSTTTSAQINVAGAATISNAAHNVNVYGIDGVAPVAGTNTYTLVHGAAGSALNPVTAPTLGTVYNATNFTVGALSRTATDLMVDITSATALTSAYWKGTATAGITRVWAASNGSTDGNWTGTAGGAVQSLVPAATTDVFISADAPLGVAPAGLTPTTLGANMSIKSLTIQDTANGLSVNADGYTLTVGTGGITMNAGVPNSTIAANVALGSDQIWTNDSVTSKTLTVSGAVSGGFSLTKAGGGLLALGGVNTYTGGTQILGGTLQTSVAGALPDAGAVTLANTSGAVLNLNGFNQTIGTLSGGGAAGGNIALGAATLTVNQAEDSQFAGVISGSGGLLKTGAGNLALAGANSYSGTTMIGGGALLMDGINTGTGAFSVASSGTLGGSGRISGPVSNNGTLAPGGGATGNLTVTSSLTLGTDSAIAWQVADWTGIAGTGYDLLTVNSLAITATSTHPVVIRLSEQALVHFTEATSTFTLIQSTGGITGFNPSKFVLDTTGLPGARYGWSIQQTGNRLELRYAQPPNTAPEFASNPILISGAQGTAITGSLTASDPDPGDTLTFSKAPGPVWLTIAANGDLSGMPLNEHVGLNEFTVLVTDSRGATATATLNLTIANLNDAPVFTVNPLTGGAATEDNAYSGSLAAAAADIDAGDTLVFSKVSGPAWLVVAPDGTFSGTPDNSDVGPNGFVVRATDAGGLFAESDLGIFVANTNDAPVWASNPVNGGNATEDAVYSGSIAGSASDMDAGATLTYAKVSGPAWLSVGSNGALTGMPVNGDVGSGSFTVSVSDGIVAPVEATLNITVVNANDAPTWTGTPLTGSDATEDSPYSGSVSASASDVDAGAILTFAKVSGPAWLAVGVNGDLSGTPTNSDVGANSFTVSVSDGTADPVAATLNITVVNTNDAPVFVVSPVAGADATEDAAYSGTLAGTATDADAGATLTFAKVSGPAWLNVAADGTLSGAPTNADVGGNNFTVSVSDGIAELVTATLEITAVNTNDVPAWASNPVIELDATEDSTYATTLANDASDVDTDDTLTFAKVSGPAWLSVAADGTLSGTPTNSDVGTNNFTVSATDGIVAPVNAALNITVLNTNDEPTWAGNPLAGADATEDSAYSATLAGSAVDVDAGAILIFAKASGPAWLGVAPDGTLSGSPTNNDVGVNSFTVSVSDGIAAAVEVSLNINVINTNDAPAFASNPITGGDATEDTVYSGTLAGAASDEDASTSLTFAKVSGPAWLSVAANGVLSGIPSNSDVGASSFTVSVSDGIAEPVNAILNITVINTNNSPTWTSNPIVGADANEDSVYSGTLAGSAGDVDVDATLIFAKASGPSWLVVGSNGTLSGTPTNSDVGPDVFTVSVTDGIAAPVEATLNITVINTNDAPVFTASPIIAAGVSEGIAYAGQTLAGQATDADAGDTITYSKVSGPAWLAVAPDGALSGTPPSGTAGLNSFVVRATDSTSATTDATLQITVTGLPLPWVSTNIGTGMLAGSATHNAGAFTQAGSGVIGGTSDKLCYTYQPLSGDGEIIARISALQNTGTSSRIGVMIRDTLAPNSKRIFMGMTGSNAYRWVRRTSTGGSTSSTSSSTGTVPNTWVRLVRAGTTITAYKSTNGTTWTTVGSTTNTTFASTCYIGLAVGSGSDTTLNTSQFSNVSVTP